MRHRDPARLAPLGPSSRCCFFSQMYSVPKKRTGRTCQLEGSEGYETNVHSAPSLMLFSVAQSCPALCDPMDCSTPGSSVLHHLQELAQIQVH